MMKRTEQRAALLPNRSAAIENRMDGNKPVLIAGYGVVYFDANDAGTEYRVDSELVERFAPGCFDAFLGSNRDALCCPYHDERRVLGRRVGSLELFSDSRGVRYSVPYDENDPDHVAIGAKISRGDVSGSSVSFVAVSERWTRDDESGLIIRDVLEAEMFHLGPVIGEAYTSTTAEVRVSDGGWSYIQQRKAEFKAAEQAGADDLLLELDLILIDE